jgi:Copper chaperone
MKKILVVMCCMLFAIAMVSAQDSKKKDKKQTTKFLVESISCDNCIKSIEKNIAFEKGVTDIKCELKTKTVEVTYNTDKSSDEKLIAAFKKINRDAVVVKDDKKSKK